MQAYAWPGNLRELHNVFERATIRSLTRPRRSTFPVAELGLGAPRLAPLRQPRASGDACRA